jgi:hypothetical protein
LELEQMNWACIGVKVSQLNLLAHDRSPGFSKELYTAQ